MKRLLILIACMSAVVGLTAGGASAGKSLFHYHLTLTPSATTLTTDESFGLSVDFSGWWLTGHTQVTVSMYDNATCTGPAIGDPIVVTTDSHGHYSVDDISIGEAGEYWFKAKVTGLIGYGTVSDCVSVKVTAPVEELTPVVEPDNGPSSFLCWNHEMVNPVAYFDSVADAMWMTGNYFEPQAVLGNVEGGTNIGAYHLVCNAVSTLKPTGSGLGGSGEVYAPEILDAYHAFHSNLNDLNLYHIFG